MRGQVFLSHKGHRTKYGYDRGWNLTVRTNGGSASSFTINALNQVTQGAGLSCTYDDNGNMITKGRINLGYDDENQLTSITNIDSGWKHDFVYDGRGRLRKVMDYTWGGAKFENSGETRYLYAGMRVLQERNSSNLPTVSYVRGLDLSGSLEGAGGIGGLLARSSGYSAGTWSTHYFYHSDGNGNVVNLTDASAAAVATYRYDPFGKTTYSSGTAATANVYRFSSKQWVNDLSAYYYGYRFYEPNLQRWLNRDPIREIGFNLLRRSKAAKEGRVSAIQELWLSPNLYEFVWNSPIVYWDSLGLESGGVLPPGVPFPVVPPGPGVPQPPFGSFCPISPGKLCRAACWGSAAAGALLTCPETGPGAVACAFAWAAAASLCSDFCPP